MSTSSPLRRRMHHLLLLAVLTPGACLACGGRREGPPCEVSRTAETEGLQTWWHENGELNSSSPVAAGNVRRSTAYEVKVASRATPNVLHDSFVYMSLPRSGQAKQGYADDDGAEFADEADLTMSWSSFLYRTDVWVQVEIKEGSPLADAGQVTIRPTTLGLRTERLDGRTIRVLVPYSEAGHRFSVEFKSEDLTSYQEIGGRLTTRGEGRPAVHTEPRNGLMIFANPMPHGAEVDQLVPDPAARRVHHPPPGEIPHLQEVTADVIHFRPGTYHMTGARHAYLRPEVRWVYLAPGAYVKGAFQFPLGRGGIKVTGFGVLSGEQYVYESDKANNYRHKPTQSLDCHGTCVKMLEFFAGPLQQDLLVHGITVTEPPYHSFVVYGDRPSLRIAVTQFKQIGGWYWQTDGLELYSGGSVTRSFFHANDDVLKLYADNLLVKDIVVWKPENGPVLQWGWAPRNIEGVHVDGIDLIHNRMSWNAHNSCILNSARHYLATHSTATAEPDALVRNLLLENIRAEGMSLCAMRLYALSSWQKIHIRNLWIERWNELDFRSQASHFQALSNAQGERVTIGNEIPEGRGLQIENYVVGSERILKSSENWRSEAAGRLDFDPTLWDSWNAW